MAVILVGGRVDAADVAVVVVPIGDKRGVHRHRLARGLGIRRIGEVDVSLGVCGEADAHGDALRRACRKRDVFGDEAVGSFFAVRDHERAVGVAEETRPPLVAVCGRGIEDAPPCLFGSVVVIGVLGIEQARIHIFGLDVGDLAVGIDRRAAAEGALEGSGKRGAHFEVLSCRCRNFVEGARIGGFARQGDFHRAVARRSVAVFGAREAPRFEVGEGCVAVRIVITVGRDDARRAVGEFDVAGLVFVRFVGEEEEALHPAVVNIFGLVVDVDGVDGVGVERGERRAVLAVHEGGVRARQAVCDLARLDEEGDEHPLARGEGDVVRLCGVGGAVRGEEHQDVAVFAEGVLALKVVLVDVLKIAVGAFCDLGKGHEARDVLFAVAERGVDALGGVRLAARDFARERDFRVVEKVCRRVEACIEVEREGVALHRVGIEDLLVRKGIDRAGVPVGRGSLFICFRRDDLALDVVEEGVAVDVFIAVGRGTPAEAEHHGEGGGSEGACTHIDGVFLPFALGVDVLDLHLVERRTAHRVGDADVRAAALRDFRLFGLGIVVGEGVRADPDGELCRRARFKRDGRARGVVLRGAEDVLARPLVVDHEHARIAVLALCRVVVEREPAAELLCEEFDVLEVDGVAVLCKELRFVGTVVKIVDLVLIDLEEFEAVVGGDVVVLPMRRRFFDGGEGGHFLVVLRVGREGVAARLREVRPISRIDDARSRIRRGRARRERPVIGRVDDAALFDDLLDILIGIKFEVAVADELRIRCGDGGILVIRVLRPVRAGGKDT